MKGQLTIINLYECEETILTSKRCLEEFGIKLCKKIKMNPYGKMVVKRFGKGKLRGYTGVQLIETSSITIHLDEHEKKAFIDIFSCKNFNAQMAEKFSKEYFKSKKAICKTIMRK